MESVRKLLRQRGFAGVRGVLLDAGNTVIRVRGSVGEVYATVAKAYGSHVAADRLEMHFRAVFGERRRNFLAGVSHPHSPQREKQWWRSLVQEVWRRCQAYEDLEERFDAFFEALYREFEDPRHWQIFDDVGPCLQRLRRHGIPVAVVSNWDSRLRKVLRGLRLEEAFQFVLTSAEFGAEKPHPSIFREALHRLQLAPEQVLHVGDAWEEDVLGARGAGLQAVWLRRDGTRDCTDEMPCATDLLQVAQWVAG